MTPPDRINGPGPDTIVTRHRPNFETLRRAFAAGDVALLACTDAATGEPVAVVCAVTFDGDAYSFVPLARFFNENPYDQLTPP